MKFEVSTLGFPLARVFRMKQLPKDFGIEIFYEWGGASFWLTSMEQVMQDRTGSFSMHAPFGYCDFARTEEKKLFRFMTEPFDLYHQLNGQHYVVHTNGHVAKDLPEAQRSDMRKLVAERLDKFQDICTAEGVGLVVENVPDDGQGLFNHDQFLQLFADNPKLDCIIDTGHAHMEHYDMYAIQRTLGSRVKAYHIHDNGGDADSHLRFLSGVPGGIDWNKFVEGVVKFTPDATLTLEYGASPEEFAEDRKILLEMAARV